MDARTPLDGRRFDPRRIARRRPLWADARKAFDALMADPDDTQKALDVMYALDPGALERDFTRFLAHPSGRRLYDEKSSLREALEIEKLSSLPAGSLGRSYLDHLERWDLDTDKLFALNWDHARSSNADPGLRWYVERSVLLHDMWHVLAGYGADDLGEAALLPFSLAQQGGLGRTLLTLGAVLQASRQAERRWPRDVVVAWRQGRHAVDLTCVPYEELLSEPLDDVRRALGLEPPDVAHRGHVPRGSGSALQRRAMRAAIGPQTAHAG